LTAYPATNKASRRGNKLDKPQIRAKLSKEMTTQRQELNPMAMLKRDELPTSPTAPGDLLIGRGARFEGKLTFEGTVRIDAVFIGTIVTNDVLVVGEAAHIDAKITCGTIVIHGEVSGNIQAKNGVEIRQSAKLRGDIDTPSLVVEKGALFQGACHMEPGAKVAPPKPVAVS